MIVLLLLRRPRRDFPVVALLGSQATSGGYFAATAQARKSAQLDYDLFVERVRDSRALDPLAAVSLSGGRVCLGREAREAGLVDGTGGWPEAWQRICGLAEQGSPETTSLEVFPRARSWLDRLRGETGEAPGPRCLRSYCVEPRTGPLGHWYLGPILDWH